MRNFLIGVQLCLFLFGSLLSLLALLEFSTALTKSEGFGLADIAFLFGSLTLVSVSALGLQLSQQRNIEQSNSKAGTSETRQKELEAFPAVGVDALAGTYATPIGKLIWHAGGPVKQSQWDAINSDAD